MGIYYQRHIPAALFPEKKPSIHRRRIMQDVFSSTWSPVTEKVPLDTLLSSLGKMYVDLKFSQR